MMRIKPLFRPLLHHHDRGISPLSKQKDSGGEKTVNLGFRIFAYSSNIIKTNFDLMDLMPACGTLK
jgi:hypothetical protein